MLLCVFAASACCLHPCSTLLKPAGDCGCPLGDSPFLSFSTKAYVTPQEVASCAPATGTRGTQAATSAGPVTATAEVLQGGIKAVTVQDGLKEVKGAVELIADIDGKQEYVPPYGGVTFVKEGQMIIRMLQDK